MKHYTSYEFDVCINGLPVKEHYHRDENVYIEGRRGSEFTLNFKNKSYEKVLVVLSVDGLSVMDGKPASKSSNGYLCEAYDSIDIPGWRIDSGKVAKFQFQPQGDRDNKTYVEELASEGFSVDPANQGVIGVMVFRQVAPPAPIPAYTTNVHHYHHYNGWYGYGNNGNALLYNNSKGLTSGYAGGGFEPLRAVGMNSMQASNFVGHVDAETTNISTPTSSVGLGTAFGKDQKFATTEVEFKRQMTPVWTGMIFYDTRSNLQKKGIVFDEKFRMPPNAFPANEGCYVPKSRR